MPKKNRIQLDFGRGNLAGTVRLTGSKSESNRALLLQALAGDRIRIENLSEADDTRLMAESLRAAAGSPSQSEAAGSGPTIIDVGPAGTVMRFMTAYLAIKPGRFLLRGSTRMHERPIGVLVEALQHLGAEISYVDRPGYPPLSISGGFAQAADRVTVPGDISSQYLSALLLIAPVLPRGLKLQIEGALTSRPYLTMTLDMLAAAGIEHTWLGDTITIAPQSFAPTTLSVEPDWSAASYWYSLLALAKSGEILLPGLRASSLQGDRMIATMMEQFGIRSSFTGAGVLLKKAANPAGTEIQGLKPTGTAVLDFTECPDIAQTVIACAAALRRDLDVTGLHTLRIKETDRIAALQTEIGKFGVQLIEDGPVYRLRTAGFHIPPELVFDTYDDHRMAMALAPLAMILGSIHINNPGVVAKSYPNFWVHLQSMGATLTNHNT